MQVCYIIIGGFRFCELYTPFRQKITQLSSFQHKYSMGRKGGRNRPRDRKAHMHRDSDHGKKDDWGGDRQNYQLAPKENKLFEQYYQGQGLIKAEEWDQFMDILRQPLPSTFRITGFRSHSKELLRIMKSSYLKELVEVEIDGRRLLPAKPLSWYPGELAWQLDLHRKLIRQNDSLKRLHQLLIQETESGNISRQEAVSMIPPLLLNVQSSSRVLDMCAAPGSKTAQMIEMLHVDEMSSVPGYVVANDADNKRCYLMTHQISRLASANFVIMNMDASNLPSFASKVSDSKRELIRFDRILCDVPCSGDGTLRKNVDAWQRWNPAIGHGLHHLQMRILRRGVELLEVGGRIVYSTCSFNPVEDEAVVSNILKQMNGSLELIDVSDQLTGLVRENGVYTWKVMSKQGEWFEKYEDVPERLRTQISPSIFPPPYEQAVAFGLDRCLRILPHKQDTGGFFVAVLEKKGPKRDVSDCTAAVNTIKNGAEQGDGVLDLSTYKIDNKTVTDGVEVKVEASTDQKQDEVNIDGKRKQLSEEDLSSEPVFKKGKYYGYREDPFIFLKKDDPIWAPVREFYGISADFPFDQLMVRCEMGKKRNIYFVSSVVKKIIQDNEDRFKFINLGVKVLSRSEAKGVDCEFRLVQDGLHLLYPYITKRLVRVGSKDDIVTLLSCENPYLSRMTKITQDQLNSFDQGSCIFIYEPCEGQDGPQCQLVVCGWKGKISCRSFLPKFERGHYLRLCGVELKTHAERLAEKAAAASDVVTDGIEPAVEDLSNLDETAEDQGQETTVKSDDNESLPDSPAAFPLDSANIAQELDDNSVQQ